MSTHRTFIAVQVSAAIRQRAASLVDRLRAADANVRWVAPEAMHLTLKFLGDVPLTESAEVCRRMADVAAGQAAHPIEVGGVGAFPTVERPRTVWIGVREGADELIALQEAIEAPLVDLGFSRERRRFTPHLTIGRVKGSHNVAELADGIKAAAESDCGRMTVSEVVAFTSELTPEGPVYRPLGRGKLGESQ